jgi:LacI family sucrose operon transcriptional repressor
MKNNIKLDDVAKEAGVSKTTASRVLNHRGYLSKETIAKVQQAMIKLNYRPNTIARQLYKQQTKLVGLIFPTINNPFFGQLANELEQLLYQQGYKVLVGNSGNDPAKEESYLHQLLERQVDGLIVGAHNQGLPEYHHPNLPIVAIDQKMNDDIPVVSSDNYQGGVLATQRLLDDGCKCIIHTNGPLTFASPTQNRRLAYQDVLAKNKLTPITYRTDFCWSNEKKKETFRQIFRDHPEVDGIFAANDTDACLIISVAAEFHKQVPADLKVVGYDGATMTTVLAPQLTTIQQPISQLATVATQILRAKIEKNENSKSVTLPVTIHNGTTA